MCVSIVSTGSRTSDGNNCATTFFTDLLIASETNGDILEFKDGKYGGGEMCVAAGEEGEGKWSWLLNERASIKRNLMVLSLA
jgi:hypothetical protein